VALAITVNDRDVQGSRYAREVSLAFSGTYTTNGEVTTAGILKDLGFSTKVTAYMPQGGGGAAVGVASEYDFANNKVKLYRTDQVDDFQEELPNATSLTGITLRAKFEGF
jgi:hypothetical protein